MGLAHIVLEAKEELVSLVSVSGVYPKLLRET